MSTVSHEFTGTPGEIVVGGAVGDPDAALEINFERLVTSLLVANHGDRPIQVGSHFHFAETNAALEFDRAEAWGRRLDIAAGTSVRFEPGIERMVQLVPFVGRRRVPGLRGLAAGPLDTQGHLDGSRR